MRNRIIYVRVIGLIRSVLVVWCRVFYLSCVAFYAVSRVGNCCAIGSIIEEQGAIVVI